MQTVESNSLKATSPIILEDIYTPPLTKAQHSVADALQAQQQQKAIMELHRFLESSCDCV